MIASLDKRLNTTALAHLCSYIYPALSAIVFLSIIPLYFVVRRNHARYTSLYTIWHLSGAWRYVFPFAIYLAMGDLTCAVLPGFEEYHIYITYYLRTIAVGYILIRYQSLIYVVYTGRWGFF